MLILTAASASAFLAHAPSPTRAACPAQSLQNAAHPAQFALMKVEARYAEAA
jgi:hypothetical protein